MKRWQKILSLVLIIVVAVAAFLGFSMVQKECCLCNSPSYSTPCLVDLETGDILQLPLDGPTTSGPEGQTDVSTFSFIRFHTVTGTKQTSPNVIELKIPADDTVNTPALCSKCRKLLPQGYDGRYALADLENNALLPIVDVVGYTIHSYRITTMLTGECAILTIQQ